ncbi:MAG: 1,3-beta-galactosyl-N-acetylhexosamine phosphorylase [Bifidobacteriaceae bacterium]|jgi:1,3-beta-galactosyl-N-acetylhexosamine phosphorylase|nr:1,3-beta-galactosyl-N-acetylhexosamine phosphorylase [Bifidobacteriaceae bacterium]
MPGQTSGRVTIPSQSGFASTTARVANLWGADAVRDSDGTALDAAVLALGLRVYSTFFPARGDNSFAREHPEFCPQMYLLSGRVTAPSAGPLLISPLKGYSRDQLQINLDDDPHVWWEVTDRTTGTALAPDAWTLEPGEGARRPGDVRVKEASAGHEYTVSFLARVVWDPVEMYNHLTNDWGDKPPDIPYDVRHQPVWEFIQQAYAEWLENHPDVDVVRFTTFFYQFSLVFDDHNREKMVDWFGYGATVSPAALEAFAAAKGYRPGPEDFVDEGYYNSSFRLPSRAYRDWMDFTSEIVTERARELVRMTHAAGKRAMMFIGDQWIGAEPYGWRFQSIGLDAVVGSVGDGTTLRIISDIDSAALTEGRFLPYLFPDTFRPGKDPAAETWDNWRRARRAILRRPIDRMGYGGYLALAAEFPDFVDAVAQIATEFREIHARVQGGKPFGGLRVGILNAWGDLRRWQAFTVAHALPGKHTYTYYGILEALAGMAVDVEFISFDEVMAGGVDPALDVVVNAGARDTAFSGGPLWRDPRLSVAIRNWVRSGGGFIGVGQPTATAHQGRFFQLADCLGVDQELGWSLSTNRRHTATTEPHFITEDVYEPLDFGESTHGVYALDGATEILEHSNGEVHLAARREGLGRSVYIAGLPYGEQNTRILLRSAYWAAARESDLKRFFVDNPACEVSYYPEAGVWCAVNNSGMPQHGIVHLGAGQTVALELRPHELVWREAR